MTNREMLLTMSTKEGWITPTLNIAILGIAVVATFILFEKIKQAYKRFCFFQSLPGSSDFSLIYGNLHRLPKSPSGRMSFAVSEMKAYNFKFHRFWFGPVLPAIVVYHPETLKRIVQSSAPKPRGTGSAYEYVLDWIGEGLIATNGERWARSRRLLTPAFHFDILKDYLQVFNEGVENLMKVLDKYAESGESFDICPLITLCTLEVILKCSLSYEANIQTEGHPYAKAVSQLGFLLSERARTPWLWPSWVFQLSSMGKAFHKNCDYVHKFAEDIIEKRKQSIEKDGVPKGRRLDFIDILLTARDTEDKPMTSKEIRNEVDTFMFAGHDTTASSIPWCLFTLTQYPEYQERIQEEVDGILDSREREDILWEDLSQLKTLSICAKESLRLFPPVPFIQRQLHQDVELDGQVIPEGTLVNISIYSLHRNPAVWDNPEEFRPERFLPENRKGLDVHAFAPFSIGARNCIGQNFALIEEKVILSRILRRYNVTYASDHKLPEQQAAIVLRAQNGIWLKLNRR